MRTVKLTVQYDGARYHGWQMQADDITVQQVLQEALTTICNQPIKIHGSGRTDAGVHALGQAAHFCTESRIELVQLVKGLNSLLPDDVVVADASEVAPGFHARFDATARTYWYFILNAGSPSPFYARYAWHVKKKLDLNAMRAAAESLVGVNDFSSFQGADRAEVNPVREVRRVRLKLVNRTLLLFEIQAGSFLKHMVRNIVGTLVETGQGRLTAQQFRQILAARDRACAGVTAPPYGLFLKHVAYD